MTDIGKGDAPGTERGVEDTVKQLSRTAWLIDTIAAKIDTAIGGFKNILEQRAMTSHRVAVSMGGSMVLAIVALVAIIGACGVVMGIDIASRQATEREADTRFTQQQREFDRRAAQMQREADARAAQLAERLQDLQRQYRMTELKLDDWTVVAHRSGLVLPGDYTRGPQGNLDTESFHAKELHHGRRRHH